MSKGYVDKKNGDESTVVRSGWDPYWLPICPSWALLFRLFPDAVMQCRNLYPGRLSSIALLIGLVLMVLVDWFKNGAASIWWVMD